MSEERTQHSSTADRFIHVIPAEDYAMLVHRDGAQYLDRVVAFGLTEQGLDQSNRSKEGVGKLVPIVPRVELLNGEIVTSLREGRGVLLHASAISTDPAKVAALKSGKPIGKL